MRATGLMGLAIFVTGVTGVADRARSQETEDGAMELHSVVAARTADSRPQSASPAGSPREPAQMHEVSASPARVARTPSAAPVPSPSAATAPRPTVAPVPDPDVAQSQEAPTRRRVRRSRSRNRYPGPIPTPAEWEPPAGPVRIALQAGHWRADEAPRELSGLRGNGTSWRDTHEWEANLSIARTAATMLEDLGYEVDVLPAVVPPGYRAHLFIAIHADGSEDPAASGFRVAAPRSDATGRADGAVDLLASTYARATGIRNLGTTTRRMRNYYAFNFRRYEHALHPMTIAVILETGFLTSSRDRDVILDAPERAARGIVEAVRAFPVTALSSESAVGPEDPPGS